LASGMAAILLLTACGSGSEYDSATAVAEGAGCTKAQPIAHADLPLVATEGVDCTFNGHAITVYWFESEARMDNYGSQRGSAHPGEPPQTAEDRAGE
jgi:hypothetical protein